MMGPTGGHLVGYLLAAALTGALAERGWDGRVAATAAAVMRGNEDIYVFGLAWLGHVMA